MKITTFLLLISMLSVSASSLAQKITLTQRNASLEKVLEEIRKQSGYDLFYTYNMLDNSRAVTVDLKNVPLEEALKSCLEGQPLTYEIEDNTIVLKFKPVAATPKSNQSNVTISTVYGIVVDTLKKPISGATVKLSPGKRVTSSNINGGFGFVDLPDGTYTLTVSSIGYQTREIVLEINSNVKLHTVNVVLKPNVAALDAITINTGYQRIKPEQSTGAVARIGTKQYESQISTDFLSGLVNRLPGLLINNDVKFEGNSLFQIRGLSTISGNRSPLIVIDGYPTELTLDKIDPNEIKSVTLLKDAAAATIYGVRASNGVIVIERKEAEPGKPQISFRATAGVSPKENYSRYAWDPNENNLIIDYHKQQVQNVGGPSKLFGQYYGSPLGYIFGNTTPDIAIMGRQGAGLITADQANQQLAALAGYDNSKDYSRLFLQNAVTQTYNLDLSGGNRNATYYITGNYNRSNPNQRNNSSNQVILSGRSNINFTSKFSLQLITDFTDRHDLASPVPGIDAFYPFEHFQDDAGNPLATFFGSSIIPEYNKYIMGLGALDNMYYPLQDMNEINTNTHSTSNRFTANFNYQLGNGFNLMFGGTYEGQYQNRRYLASGTSSVVRKLVDYYAVYGAGGSLTYNIPRGGYLQQTSAQSSDYTGRIQLNYLKILGKDHAINAIVGGEIRDVKSQSNLSTSFGYDDTNLLQSAVNYTTLFDVNKPIVGIGYYSGQALPAYSSLFNQSYTDNRYLSGFSNVAYTYRSKYTLSSSVRIDQSNLFGTDPKYKYKPLWSVGGNWNIDQEGFMREVNWIKRLKLRVAYGFNGNVAKNALPQVIATAAYNNYFPAGTNVTQLDLSSYANSGLRWEQTKNLNVGLDLVLFRVVNVSVDFYDKKSTDLLGSTQIDATKGGAFALINTSALQNRGIELNLQSDWITNRNFNWNTGLALSYNTSKVLKVYNEKLTSNSVAADYLTAANSNFLVGYPIGSIFAYRYAGISNDGAALAYHADGSKGKVGFETFYPADVYNAGTSIPRYNAGLTNRIDIGRFYIFTMINYYGGFKVMVPMPNPLAGSTRLLAGSSGYWQKPGDENIPNMLPGLNAYSMVGAAVNQSDRYVVNGDYFTLGVVTASYNFADKISFLKKAGFHQFELKLQGANLYTVALNKYDYSLASRSGNPAKTYLTPTYTIALFTNF